MKKNKERNLKEMWGMTNHTNIHLIEIQGEMRKKQNILIKKHIQKAKK